MNIDEQALAECDAEPIHIPGVIQDHGALIAFDQQSFAVSHVSDNAAKYLGREPDDLLTSDAEEVFGSRLTHTLRSVLQMPNADAQREPIGCFADGDDKLELFAFTSGESIVVEMEPVAEAPWTDANLSARIGELFALVNHQTEVDGLLKAGVKWLEVISGYDRVMIYRFKEDWSGEVVAERNMSEHEDYLGLSFPRWDIPTQARAIMLKLPLRMITDVHAQPIPIRAVSKDLPPLDISQAHLRGVSPIHLKYLHNMGVASTMTLSIVVDGKLWGLVSFHHYAPKVPTARVRAIAVPFIQYFNVKLAQLEVAETTRAREDARRILDDIRDSHGDGADLATLVSGNPMPLMEQFQAHGMAVRINDNWQTFGKVVPAAAAQSLIDEAVSRKTVFSTDRACDLEFDRRWQEEGLAGALAISLGGDDVALVFREEIEAKLKWAGRPEKDIAEQDGTYRLTPRGSFDLFVETVKGRSKPWRPIDIELAEGLTALFLQSEKQRQKIERKFFEDRDRQQKLMISELNHRVRNILALIRSVSRQARRSNASLKSYSAALEHRIKALAVAHDLSNDTGLASVRLAEIIRTELSPYADAGTERFTLTGDDWAIRPDLCPIFALVIHEMTTNAVKYGALSVPDGSVAVGFFPQNDGLFIRWEELGGPAAVPPENPGFGTDLIKNAIPFELEGKVELRFEESGLTVEIWLPEAVLSAPDAVPTKAYVSQFPANQQPKLSGKDLGTALLVEDNYVIGLDTEVMLEEIGFSKVLIASNVERALALTSRKDIQIGILDMHLGDETSFAVARELNRRDVPVIFATGYGSDVGRPPGLDHLPLVTKPVEATTLATEIAKAILPEHGAQSA